MEKATPVTAWQGPGCSCHPQIPNTNKGTPPSQLDGLGSLFLHGVIASGTLLRTGAEPFGWGLVPRARERGGSEPYLRFSSPVSDFFLPRRDRKANGEDWRTGGSMKTTPPQSSMGTQVSTPALGGFFAAPHCPSSTPWAPWHRGWS